MAAKGAGLLKISIPLDHSNTLGASFSLAPVVVCITVSYKSVWNVFQN